MDIIKYFEKYVSLSTYCSKRICKTSIYQKELVRKVDPLRSHSDEAPKLKWNCVELLARDPTKQLIEKYSLITENEG